MHLEAGKTLRVPLEAELVEEGLDELALALDDFKAIVGDAKASIHVLVANDDDADMRVVGTTVDLEVIVVRLQAVEERLDRVVRRVRQKLAARVDCEN